jgi:hypothetical protein
VAKTPMKLNDEEWAELIKRQRAVEASAALVVETKAAHKAAKATHEENQDRLGQYLYAIHHGMPLFDGEAEGEE